MTSLAAWTSADSRGISAIYIIGDSRMTWEGSSSWDFSRKIFNSSKYPHIFGYCGDAFFPSIILSSDIKGLQN